MNSDMQQAAPGQQPERAAALNHLEMNTIPEVLPQSLGIWLVAVGWSGS